MTTAASASPEAHQVPSYDIAIIGGGLVGASLACALEGFAKRHNWSIAVIEAIPTLASPAAGDGGSGIKSSYDARSTALSWGTRHIYEQIGLWQQLEPHVAPIRKIHVSDKGHLGATRLNAADHHVDALGYVAPNIALGQILLNGVKQAQHVEWLCPFKVTGFDINAEKHRLTLSRSDDGGEHQIEAGLVVLADGGQSGLKQQLNIVDHVRPYDQYAIVCNLTMSQPHENWAFERFTADGPMAWLPLPEAKDVALVWTVPAEQMDEVSELSEADFKRKLLQLFGPRLGDIERIGERHQYPLTLIRATEQVRPGLAVLGNAAHYMHPVAGQGYNLALRGVAELAGVLHEAANQGGALGSLSTLQRYQQRRESDQDAVIGFSDGLIRLFANGNPVLGHLRAGGLMLLDRLKPAKRWFARQAMGIGGSSVRLYPLTEQTEVPGPEQRAAYHEPITTPSGEV
ncbi:2-octaprenyl-6-methoxyphenyl hydroxylase [Oceanospirillum linum]|uniref:2-octaprenyl-6-methoxyphenyl hydroxylase n=1 Tax=Oceanospirillum linum TaxID=966 RepID=A0A1T1HBN4_OCELI|nr:2-octaprenyl-6-methoxyphenyl hydroxylase [Oceanospirillum linum]OOV87206.1 2-octaprenyl-6-methoxyphenyl hydroxylase [Oceanospirillum linum]SEF77784.1 2-octaprenyl-6-methoxyphenol hydroxylase /2-octaprenyl-3-methyl-6-methoxy-1,4-benzoquinol hydroxylase [Oleiphilus messinensis]SMP17848.1 2-octaprenyl-6-methoxyphenol hydroxylase /2-octaprenyl-3-methyl-6-methoxy-1,4-benzoquinol hydroxylase [Oceanospirillum linum]